MVDRVGQQLGNYTIVRKLGEGGFAEVYLGEHIHLGTYAAIKILHTQLLGGDTDTFRREARTVAHLIHPHIVRVLDFGIEGSTPFLVMDYAPHGTLRQRHPRGTRLPLSTVVEYVGQISAGLQYAHDKKLIHRDVKPENMLIGQSNALLLSDFGIALVTQSSRYQGTMEMAGTMAYMSPEQIQGKPRPASDQYALGIIVYEWLTGDRPFHGSLTEIVAQHLAMSPPPLREQLPTIPQAVEEVIMTALAKDPHTRYDSVRTFAEELKLADQELASPASVPLPQMTLIPSLTNVPTTPNTLPSLSPTPSNSSPTSINRESEVVPTASNIAGVPLPIPHAMFVPPPQKRRITRKLVLAGLALLILLLVGFGVYYPIALYNASLIRKIATPTQAQTNATAQSFATANANIYASVTVTNGVSVTQTATAYTNTFISDTSGSAILNDPLSDNSNNNNWDTSNSTTASGCVFNNSTYHVIERQKGYFQPCFAKSTNFSDLAYEVQMTVDTGTQGGIVFRANGSQNTFYLFRIGIDGSYFLDLYKGNTTPVLLSFGYTAAITPGLSQHNTIAVIAVQHSIDLYVNQQYIASVTNTILTSGSIGVASYDDSVPTEIEFSNAQVWDLSSSATPTPTP